MKYRDFEDKNKIIYFDWKPVI